MHLLFYNSQKTRKSARGLKDGASFYTGRSPTLFDNLNLWEFVLAVNLAAHKNEDKFKEEEPSVLWYA
jgi:hypothetical protein